MTGEGTPRKRRSILRRAIAAVLLLEFIAAVLLTAVTAAHEAHVRYRAFDATLRGKAAAMLGAVGEADDAGDNVVLDLRGLKLPEREFYEVWEPGRGVLGASRNWPFHPPHNAPEGGLEMAARGRHYHVAALRGVRVVDPGEPGGGTPHSLLVLYGAPTGGVEHEVWEAVRFYALTFGCVMLITAVFLAVFLRRAFVPLRELTEEAGKLSAQAWRFAPPPSAAATEELAPLSAALEASVKRLQRSFEQQRRFTGDAAHELKTGVAILKSSLQLLTLRPRSAAEYRGGLARSLADCERMEETVGEMLVLARVENAGGPRMEGSTDLAAEARAALEGMAPMGALLAIRLQALELSCAPVALSPKDARLLCTNLLENALQHSSAGAEVFMLVAAASGSAVLEVRDRGEGIEARAMPHIFEPFFRGDEARARGTGGTGLGLAICKAICDAAGGSIAVASERGSGTVVSVRLPLSPAPVNTPAAAFSETAQS